MGRPVRAETPLCSESLRDQQEVIRSQNHEEEGEKASEHTRYNNSSLALPGCTKTHYQDAPHKRSSNTPRLGPLRASALSYLPLGDGARSPRPPRGGKRATAQEQNDTTSILTRIKRRRQWEARRPPPQPLRTEGVPGQHRGSPRRSGTGNEPRSTRPYSTVPLPVPSPRNGCGGRPETQQRVSVMGARGVTRIRRLDDAPEPAGNPPGGEGTTSDRIAEQELQHPGNTGAPKPGTRGVRRPQQTKPERRPVGDGGPAARSYPAPWARGRGRQRSRPARRSSTGGNGSAPSAESPKPRSQGHQEQGLLKEARSGSVRPKLVALQEPENLLQGPEGTRTTGRGFWWNKPLFNRVTERRSRTKPQPFFEGVSQGRKVSGESSGGPPTVVGQEGEEIQDDRFRDVAEALEFGERLKGLP
ncbi:hypothetical protein GWK47_012469 [Chionoecetes opilio]|uniref:Uncharacterized protein n=1 Tax=Chionoecetes opilio TaxID=41210 RepID=A0A8J5CLR9_CHIOP|nr:hypothetical protein GWK47_012469 [Chionoecetes opilio]